MKFSHLYQTEAEHAKEYVKKFVGKYKEPWVDYVRETKESHFNLPDTPIDFSKEYLILEAIESGTFTFTILSALSATSYQSISYSIDNGETWVTTNNVDNQQVVVTTPTIQQGGIVMWKGTGTTLGTGNSAGCSFSSSGKFNVLGNVMSLLYGDDFSTASTLANFSFVNLFSSSKVVSAKNLVLPAMTLPRRCYGYMFTSCKELVDAPETIPASGHSNTAACHSMFKGCSKLKNAPSLPATSIGGYCYQDMFSGCRALETAPELPSLTLVTFCYSRMFENCSSLRYVKAMFKPAPNSVSNSTTDWLNGVAASGTFVMNSEATWNPESYRSASGVPTGWTVETA